MIRAILTDIEGTTSSLSFVKDVLFPYAHQQMSAFVRDHSENAEVRALLDEAKTAMEGEVINDDDLIAQLRKWIDEDRKFTPLKTLQGLMWKEGYERGDFQGHIYEDAMRMLDHWRQTGLALYIFSSGSVQAQKLLFAYTEYGDLTPWFSGYFDTTTGRKQDHASYKQIAERIGVEPQAVLFLSDSRDELDAARTAGMRTVQVMREGKPSDDAAHPQVRDFDAIELPE